MVALAAISSFQRRVAVMVRESSCPAPNCDRSVVVLTPRLSSIKLSHLLWVVHTMRAAHRNSRDHRGTALHACCCALEPLVHAAATRSVPAANYDRSGPIGANRIPTHRAILEAERTGRQGRKPVLYLGRGAILMFTSLPQDAQHGLASHNHTIAGLVVKDALAMETVVNAAAAAQRRSCSPTARPMWADRRARMRPLLLPRGTVVHTGTCEEEGGGSVRRDGRTAAVAAQLTLTMLRWVLLLRCGEDVCHRLG